MKTHERHTASSKGFMLIEIMVALLLLGIAFAGLSPLTIATLRSMDHAQRVTTATEVARDKIEDIRSTDYASVTSGADVLKQGDTGATYERTWTAEDGPATDTKVVTVTVNPTARTTRPVSLQTIVAR